MTAILLVCLPSVALGREAADAALGPAASKSFLLLVWSPLPCIRDTASIPAKQALSHLFWPTGVNVASHEASCPSSEIMVIFNQKVVQKIKAPPPCKLTQNIWINFQVSWLFYHLIHTHTARNCNSVAINLPPETVLARQSPHTTQVVLQTAALFLKQNMDVFSSPLPNKYMKCATWQVACRWQNSQNSAEIQDGVARRIPTTLCQKKKAPNRTDRCSTKSFVLSLLSRGESFHYCCHLKFSWMKDNCISHQGSVLGLGCKLNQASVDVSALTSETQKEVILNLGTIPRGTAGTKEIACTRGQDRVFSVRDRLRQNEHSSFWGKSFQFWSSPDKHFQAVTHV